MRNLPPRRAADTGCVRVCIISIGQSFSTSCLYTFNFHHPSFPRQFPIPPRNHALAPLSIKPLRFVFARRPGEMDRTLGFLAEDRRERAERAERIASNSGGSSSRGKKSTTSGSKSGGSGRGGDRNKVSVKVAAEGSDVLCGNGSGGSGRLSGSGDAGQVTTSGHGSRPLSSSTQVQPPKNELEWIKLMNA
jgi:hypothetical protein